MNAETKEELFYQIALTQTDWIGNRLARVLLSKFESAKEIFHSTGKELSRIENFGEQRIKALKKEINVDRIEKEIAFITKHNIEVLLLKDKKYPYRLKECPDAPVLLYYKGNADLNASKVISIVGTRMNSDYGLRCAESLIAELKTNDILIVSGLAFGIDAIAHRKALQCNIPTVGVVAHGLDRIYPVQHKKLAKEMVENGGLLTEHLSGTQPDKQNFPTRNRIVAGMADITLVVETDQTGGSMITAKLAASYNREVATFPGRTTDPKSKGCNYLIKTHIAHLISDASDLMELMNWNKNDNNHVIQQRLFSKLSKEEATIAAVLEKSDTLHIDELQIKTSITNPKLSSLLLSLELEGFVKSLPGKRYRLT